MLKESLVRVFSLLIVGFSLVMMTACTEDKPKRVTFDAAHTSGELEQVTIDIVGRPPGKATLKDVEEKLRASVRDMNSLSEEEYRQKYDRSPWDQASLNGTWVGLATNELPGKARREHLNSLATELSGSTPNDLSDNPRNPGMETARALFQAAYAFTRKLG